VKNKLKENNGSNMDWRSKNYYTPNFYKDTLKREIQYATGASDRWNERIAIDNIEEGDILKIEAIDIFGLSIRKQKL